MFIADPTSFTVRQMMLLMEGELAMSCKCEACVNTKVGHPIRNSRISFCIGIICMVDFLQHLIELSYNSTMSISQAALCHKGSGAAASSYSRCKSACSSSFGRQIPKDGSASQILSCHEDIEMKTRDQSRVSDPVILRRNR